MTQENCPELNNLIQDVEGVILRHSEQDGVSDEVIGREIRGHVGNFLSICGESLPPTLTVYRSPYSPDFQLHTRTGELVNIVAQRPRSLSDEAWWILGREVVKTLQRAVIPQSV